MSRHTFGTAQHYTASIHQNDFRDWFLAVRDVAAAVIEIKQFARQRKLRQIFWREWLRILQHRKDLRAGVHPMYYFGFHRQDLPDMLAYIRRLIVQHFGDGAFASAGERQSKMTTAL